MSNTEKNGQPQVAYFCMEYGLDSSLKTYAGGLGILAGDYLKGALDHGYPIVGIGIKWKQGYVDQKIGKDGRPFDVYQNNEYKFLQDTGITVAVKIRQRDVMCKVWKVDHFGNVPLYLLDTDIPENEDTWITGQLYGWFGEERVAQEIVLGVGGMRALRALGIEVDVYHFNEGHAVFAGLELIRENMAKGASFEAAWAAARNQIVFTTHTPVLAGNESHDVGLLTYMGAGNDLTAEQLIRLGNNPFNMTIAGLRLSRIANAVSKLHAETAKKMWAYIEDRASIIGVTNAIHVPTWVDPAITETIHDPAGLWKNHQRNKAKLVSFIREKTGAELDPEVLLIGFSRRAAPYKRSNFIFAREEIIGPLLRDGKLQLVFSGKAHPLDDVGKEIIANLVRMTKVYPQSVVFLENYDMEIAHALTRGADIWLNNPRRPKEASGTSGMKAAMNGVLNFSILDGWWPEACIQGYNGWQFGDGFESENEQIQDQHDLDALYQVLLHDVIPTYYERREVWIRMMQNSITSTKDEFAMKRMLEEYFHKMYEENR